MHIDPALQTKADNYKLLTNLVVPRPIAWVTSMREGGGVNLAPFSFFNAVGSDPLYVVISVGRKTNGEHKDTARNILETGAFVVNMVTEELLGAMNVSAADFPEDESELTAAKLNIAPSLKIKVPRVAEAEAALECQLHSSQPLGAYTLIIGEVVMFHVADHLLGELGSGFKLAMQTLDIFRVDDDLRMAEHWDVLQIESVPFASHATFY